MEEPIYFGVEYCKIDPKGRIMFPKSYRDKIKNIEREGLRITTNLDGCFTIYTKQTWEQMLVKLNELNSGNKKTRQLYDFFMRSYRELFLDSMGRILIPHKLLKSAGIEKECIFFNNKYGLKLQSAEQYDEITEEIDKNPEAYSDLAEEVNFEL